MFLTPPVKLPVSLEREDKNNTRDMSKILWIRVIYQAVEDLTHPAQGIRVNAKKFLSGETEALQDICTAIELNDTVLIKAYQNGRILELKKHLRQKCL